MAGPGILLHDPERGAPEETRDLSSAPSGKVRSSADIRADSSRSASPREDTNVSTEGSHNHNLLEKLKTHVPPSVQNKSSTIWGWLRGPNPPRLWKIRPLLPRLQQLPLRLVDKLLPRQWQRIAALFVYYVCWIATFAAVLHKSSVVDDVNGYGQPILISCGAVFW